MAGVNSLIQDPEFQALPKQKQKEALSGIDPEFQGLSDQQFDSVISGIGGASRSYGQGFKVGAATVRIPKELQDKPSWGSFGEGEHKSFSETFPNSPINKAIPYLDAIRTFVPSSDNAIGMAVPAEGAVAGIAGLGRRALGLAGALGTGYVVDRTAQSIGMPSWAAEGLGTAAGIGVGARLGMSQESLNALKNGGVTGFVSKILRGESTADSAKDFYRSIHGIDPQGTDVAKAHEQLRIFKKAYREGGDEAAANIIQDLKSGQWKGAGSKNPIPASSDALGTNAPGARGGNATVAPSGPVPTGTVNIPSPPPSVMPGTNNPSALVSAQLPRIVGPVPTGTINVPSPTIPSGLTGSPSAVSQGPMPAPSGTVPTGSQLVSAGSTTVPVRRFFNPPSPPPGVMNDEFGVPTMKMGTEPPGETTTVPKGATVTGTPSLHPEGLAGQQAAEGGQLQGYLTRANDLKLSQFLKTRKITPEQVLTMAEQDLNALIKEYNPNAKPLGKSGSFGRTAEAKRADIATRLEQAQKLSTEELQQKVQQAIDEYNQQRGKAGMRGKEGRSKEVSSLIPPALPFVPPPPVSA